MSVLERPRVPARVEALLHALCATADVEDDVLGDLAEEFQWRVPAYGAGAARLWYYREALRTAPYLLGHWARRFRRRDAAAVVVGGLSAVVAGAVADAIVTIATARLTMLVTGIPLAAYANHWMSTGDLMSPLLVALVLRRTIPPAIAGCAGALSASRAPLASSVVLSAFVFAVAATSIAMSAQTLDAFALRIGVQAIPLAALFFAGGVFGSLPWTRFRNR